MVALIALFIGLFAGICIGFMLGFSHATRLAAQPHGKQRTIIAKLVIATGCALLVAALISAIHTWRFTRAALKTSGTVIEMRERTDKDSGSVSYSPTFRFQDSGGAQHTVSSSLYSSPPEFHVGDNVPILYRGESPETARIDSYSQVWGLSCLLGIIGSIQLPSGLVMLFWPTITARFRRRE
jgi:hypothetical protein